MPASRSTLISLLSEACELEHGLACSYLYAAFSLKQEVAEGGLDWRQLQQVRRWAAELYAIAAEEMLHLAQAWNLLAAVGGSPYYLRPNFPQSRMYYGFHLPLALERFGRRALRRFIAYETPVDLLPARAGAIAAASDDAPAEFRSVGELYALIGAQIAALPEATLFFRGSQGEMDEAAAHFPDLLPVGDAASAQAAIGRITQQGEGVPTDREDCHFGVFKRVLRDLEAALAADAGFAPARPAVDNPVARLRADWAGGGPVTPIRDGLARQVGDLFDDVYTLMLRLLQHGFASGPRGPAAGPFAETAILAMTTVLKPLGEGLTLLPSGRGDGSRAGAAFGLTRHVPLPADPAIASTVAAERAAELAAVGEALARDAAAPRHLEAAAGNLARAAGRLAEVAARLRSR